MRFQLSKLMGFLLLSMTCSLTVAQVDTITLGFGGSSPITSTTSNNANSTNGNNTMSAAGFLPNENAASRFLSMATLGYHMDDIQYVASLGLEAYLTEQFAEAMPYTLTDRVRYYHNYSKNATGNSTLNASSRYWDYAWWQYHMVSDDVVRQKVAYALSQLLVISENSNFGGEPYALSSYYDILLNNAFGNYRDLIEEVTYHPAMARYLTYLNNPKTDTTENRFPDENYARELMQLFTIGTTMLNNDGTMQYDGNGVPIPTYDNYDIQEYSKVFTGMSWGDRTQWNRGQQNDTSYLVPLQLFNDWHEPGVKNLLNGFQIPDRNPVDGAADINDALDNLFNHPNTPPFVSKFLIQRLVTANPPPAYVERVANTFMDNGNGVRGDMKAVITAILLDPYATSCESANDITFGMLREPFLRYVQINKAFNVSTNSGNFRNDMDWIQRFVSQKPLASPSVFNFYQQDYQPIGAIEDEGLVAPVFQITDAQTIAGHINGIYRFIVQENIADEYSIYSGEPFSAYEDDVSQIDLIDETMLAEDDEVHVLLDQLNLRLAQGHLSQTSLDIIKETILQHPAEDEEDREDRVKLAIYLVLSSPEYLIHR